MKHLILGTAGHIDHGKTTLVKVLTGIDCDTHKEEKRRGITINLGFAHYEISAGNNIGIVDVPGHRDFVQTMVAGASGIDIVLMVIAADSGIMQQTREHCGICDVLGVRSGIIVITKTDLVDTNSLKRLHEEIAKFTKNTFLEHSPLVDVSCVTGYGIDTLKKTIEETVASVSERKAGTVFRMYIDRIFSVSGFGTVVTGSVKSGRIGTDAKAYLLPTNKELRVRRIERYGVPVDNAVAGDRASLNLAGISKEEFERGMMIADRPLHSSNRIDVKIRLFEHAKPIGIWSVAEFIMGTLHTQVKIHLIESDRAKPGDTAIAQIHLPLQCVSQMQDTFVLRNSSGEETIGGGEVIDPHPLHHKRRPKELIENLQMLSTGKLGLLVRNETLKHTKGIAHAAMADLLNVSVQDIDALFEKDLPPGVVVLSSEKNKFLIDTGHLESLYSFLKKVLSDFHKKHPLLETGRTKDELLGILGLGDSAESRDFAGVFLHSAIQMKIVKRIANTYSLYSHAVHVSKQDTEQGKLLEEYFKRCGMQTPIYADAVLFARKHSIDEKRLKQLLGLMVSAKMLYCIENAYLHCGIVDKARKLLLDELAGNQAGLTVARFRDLVNGNRKICLLLYALFDAEGIIQRKEDVRVITEKGRQLVHKDP